MLDIIKPMVRATDDLLDLDGVAELIAEYAEKMSKKQDYISPFAKEAFKHFYDMKGGKPDDITVIVA